MKQVPIFIAIPEVNVGLHYLLPDRIVRLTSTEEGCSVYFTENCKIYRIKTLLTSDEIHERMMEINSIKESSFWGGVGGSNE